MRRNRADARRSLDANSDRAAFRDGVRVYPVSAIQYPVSAILYLCKYVQYCVCAIHRYPKYPVSAILGMCEYVQYMQYYHVLRRRSPCAPVVPRDMPVSTCMGSLKAFRARFSMSTTTTRILAMSTVLKTRVVGLYLVYETIFRYISSNRRRALTGENP